MTDGSSSDSRPVVCQVLHSLAVGGAEVLAARFARNMSKEFRFVFACLDTIGTLGIELQSEGFEVCALGRKQGIDLGVANRLASFIKKTNTKVIHAHQYTPYFYSALARGFFGSRPLMFTEHGRHQPDFRRWKRVLANRVFLKQHDQVIAVGEAVRKALIDFEGFPPPRVEVIYNGIDLSRYPADRSERASVRSDLGIQDEHFALAQVARLDYLKDHKTSLRAFALAYQKFPRMRLFVVGEGPERDAIASLIDELKLESAVQLLGLRSDVPQLLQGMDALILSSLSEGIPLTLIEGMAAQLPIISTDVGGVSEIISSREFGTLVPASRVDALGDAIIQLATMDRRASHAIGESGRRRAIERFDENEMHRRYASCYREMIASSY